MYRGYTPLPCQLRVSREERSVLCARVLWVLVCVIMEEDHVVGACADQDGSAQTTVCTHLHADCICWCWL